MQHKEHAQTHTEAMIRPSSLKPLAPAVNGLVESFQLLAHRAVDEYRPIVETIQKGQSRDIGEIERTLDGLLDFCFDAEALLLYKQLCRHYLPIDPVATAAYVHAYREMWDTDGEARI